MRSHFLEFLPVNSDGESDVERPHLAHELETNQQYSVVLTTGGGFYRYHLGDIIEVIGREQQCRLVRFLSRRQISDWRGEKLHESHVSRALQQACAEEFVQPRFSMLAWDTNCYVLYLEAEASEDRLISLASNLERQLQVNFHYQYARCLGQIGPVRPFAASNAADSYMNACVARGQRAGNIKPVALDPRDGWTARFNGRFVEAAERVT